MNQKLRRQARQWLIESIRSHLVPVFLQRGFILAPLAKRGPVDREVLASLPFGRLRRTEERGVELIEIELARFQRPAFLIKAGVAPKDGLMTLTGHWSAEDLFIDWLNESFEMYASPRWRRWFSVTYWPGQSPQREHYEDLVLRVAGYVPELEAALSKNRVGPHIRRLVMRHPAPPNP